MRQNLHCFGTTVAGTGRGRGGGDGRGITLLVGGSENAESGWRKTGDGRWEMGDGRWPSPPPPGRSIGLFVCLVLSDVCLAHWLCMYHSSSSIGIYRSSMRISITFPFWPRPPSWHGARGSSVCMYACPRVGVGWRRRWGRAVSVPFCEEALDNGRRGWREARRWHCHDHAGCNWKAGTD
ncbi:hypothetical protein LY78DRAFT_310554 [Colletotrichum sublineola]|nr:hypothetical protein LY78DRAFT_310554 [Colletotrichum sublineola]